MLDEADADEEHEPERPVSDSRRHLAAVWSDDAPAAVALLEVDDDLEEAVLVAEECLQSTWPQSQAVRLGGGRM